MVKIPYLDKKLFVVTDIHGNLDDFKYYLNLWLEDTSNYICFCGDLIHADRIEEDQSLMILDMVKEYIDYDTFHVLLGNHELSQILGEEVYRYNVNQTNQFQRLVEEAYPNEYLLKYQEYRKLLQNFNYYLETSNGFFIIHSGINEEYLESILNEDVDIYQLNLEYDYEKELLTECLWSRPYDDYTEKTIKKFIDHTNNKYMISGHTDYNGYKTYGNQLIINSSHITENKYYLELKLNQDYNITQLKKSLKKKKHG